MIIQGQRGQASLIENEVKLNVSQAVFPFFKENIFLNLYLTRIGPIEKQYKPPTNVKSHFMSGFH